MQLAVSSCRRVVVVVVGDVRVKMARQRPLLTQNLVSKSRPRRRRIEAVSRSSRHLVVQFQEWAASSYSCGGGGVGGG